MLGTSLSYAPSLRDVQKQGIQALANLSHLFVKLVASLLLVVRPGAPSSVLAPIRPRFENTVSKGRSVEDSLYSWSLDTRNPEQAWNIWNRNMKP